MKTKTIRYRLAHRAAYMEALDRFLSVGRVLRSYQTEHCYVIELIQPLTKKG